MAREEDRLSAVCVIAGDLSHQPDAVRIQPRGRFVENEEVRVPHQGNPESKPLAHPLRVPAGLPTGGLRREADALEQFVGIVVRALEIDRVLEVFEPSESVVESVSVRENPDAAVDFPCLPLAIQTQYRGRSGRRAGVIHEHVDGRRLPGSVRTEEAEDFARVDREIEVVDGENGRSIAFRQPAGPDGDVGPLRRLHGGINRSVRGPLRMVSCFRTHTEVFGPDGLCRCRRLTGLGRNRSNSIVSWRVRIVLTGWEQSTIR